MSDIHDTKDRQSSPSPTMAERKEISKEYNVKPFVSGLVALGIFGMIAITVVAIFVKQEMALVIATLIVTFCGTITAGVLTLTRITEVKERLDGRLDELLDMTGKHQFDAGMRKGVNEERELAICRVAENVRVTEDGIVAED
jgi:hypothetical protein